MFKIDPNGQNISAHDGPESLSTFDDFSPHMEYQFGIADCVDFDLDRAFPSLVDTSSIPPTIPTRMTV